MSVSDDATALVEPARLIGRLLVREIDAGMLAELTRGDVRDAIAGIGIDLPASADFDALANEYFEALLHPTDGFPPVQSLWQVGQYDGDSAVSVRSIAAAAAREIAPGARGAPPDHLGCILLLWAELFRERPELADRLRRDHLRWAIHALAPLAQRPGFYGSVAAAAVALIREIVG